MADVRTMILYRSTFLRPFTSSRFEGVGLLPHVLQVLV